MIKIYIEIEEVSRSNDGVEEFGSGHEIVLDYEDININELAHALTLLSSMNKGVIKLQKSSGFLGKGIDIWDEFSGAVPLLDAEAVMYFVQALIDNRERINK